MAARALGEAARELGLDRTAMGSSTVQSRPRDDDRESRLPATAKRSAPGAPFDGERENVPIRRAA